MNCTRRIDPKTSCLGFPRHFTLFFGSSDGSASCETQPSGGTVFHKSHSTRVVAFSVLKAIFRLFTWLFFNLVVREQTLVPCFASRFSFIELTFGRIPILKVISYKYLSNSMCTVVEEFCQSQASLSRRASTLLSLMAQTLERLSVSVLVHDHHSHAGKCTGLPSNTGLSLSTGNKNLFLFQRHLCPFDS